jgi:hypothetical protein
LLEPASRYPVQQFHHSCSGRSYLLISTLEKKNPHQITKIISPNSTFEIKDHLLKESHHKKSCKMSGVAEEAAPAAVDGDDSTALDDITEE